MNDQLASHEVLEDDERFQENILGGVSRTFALTIPQLPASLRDVVTNAYLLCRIADTIEDDPGISAAEKEKFHEWYIDTLEVRRDPGVFAQALEPLLSENCPPPERELVRHAARVVRVCHSFDPATQEVLVHRVALMCRGMPLFQHHTRHDGLPNLAAMDQYCYYVAGVVGQMLTELFSGYSGQIARVREPLFNLSASFGQGLQMTNILKDVWEDRARGVCWLPRELFAAHGYDLAGLHPDHNRAAFTRGLQELLGVTHAHLRNALQYTLLIPARETGIRRFCLWSLVLAVLTLQRIRRNPHYNAGAQVKVSRRAVRHTIRVTGAISRSDPLIRALFAWAARGLPLAREVTTYPEFSQPILRAQ